MVEHLWLVEREFGPVSPRQEACPGIGPERAPDKVPSVSTLDGGIGHQTRVPVTSFISPRPLRRRQRLIFAR